MSTMMNVLIEMETLMGKCGINPDIGVGITLSGHSSTTNLHLHSESQTPETRAALVELLGEPERPTWDKKNACWSKNLSYRIVAYNWPWPTCETCGQLKPSDAPVPSGG